MEKIEVEEEREMEVSREKELFQLGTSGSLQTHCCFSTLIKAGILDFAVLCAEDLKGQEEHRMEQDTALNESAGLGEWGGRWEQGRKELGNKELPEPRAPRLVLL